ncbi:MAG: hypothetical protein V1704_02365 [Candidatus Vogelbacteria bacterium]
MKKIIIFGGVIIVLILLGYSRWGNYLCGNCWTRPKPVTLALVAQDDSGKQGSPRGEAGEATLTEVDGQVKVELKLTGEAVDPQPAEINRGRCGALGEAVYSLSPVVGGSSVTTITASFVALEANLPLSINANNFCGDLILE